MKSRIKFCLFLAAVVYGQTALSQTKNHSLNNKKMEATIKVNKDIIHILYEDIMNKRKFDLLKNVVAEDYANAQGENGFDAFKKGIVAVIDAFPDAKWSVAEIIAEKDKVFVKHQVQGTHKGTFQNIPATNHAISNVGMVIYEFKNGKIVNHQIQTDRFSFFQQLGILPKNFPATKSE